MRRTLLLNNSYEILDFVEDRRAIKLLLNEKVEVISAWEDIISYSGGQFKFPSVVRLKRQVRTPNKGVSFSRRAVFRRDGNNCQYCGKGKATTIDHIVPKFMGGKNEFLNCVAACVPCNQKKGRRSLPETGMKLMRQPTVPLFSSLQYPDDNNLSWHEDWNFYFRIT
jgi:5-methylcytosine-specific restriction endonuclease McrA